MAAITRGQIGAAGVATAAVSGTVFTVLEKLDESKPSLPQPNEEVIKLEQQVKELQDRNKELENQSSRKDEFHNGVVGKWIGKWADASEELSKKEKECKEKIAKLQEEKKELEDLIETLSAKKQNEAKPESSGKKARGLEKELQKKNEELKEKDRQIGEFKKKLDELDKNNLEKKNKEILDLRQKVKDKADYITGLTTGFINLFNDRFSKLQDENDSLKKRLKDSKQTDPIPQVGLAGHNELTIRQRTIERDGFKAQYENQRKRLAIKDQKISSLMRENKSLLNTIGKGILERKELEDQLSWYKKQGLCGTTQSSALPGIIGENTPWSTFASMGGSNAEVISPKTITGTTEWDKLPGESGSNAQVISKEKISGKTAKDKLPRESGSEGVVIPNEKISGTTVLSGLVGERGGKAIYLTGERNISGTTSIDRLPGESGSRSSSSIPDMEGEQIYIPYGD